MSKISNVIKRDGTVVPFDREKIETAIALCYRDTFHNVLSTELEQHVDAVIAKCNELGWDAEHPYVEDIQTSIEHVLIDMNLPEQVRHFMLFREKRAQLRESAAIPITVEMAFSSADGYFAEEYQRFMFYDKYSRYNRSNMRRETWVETVQRVVDYLRELSHDRFDDGIYAELEAGILNMEVMPSMRLLAMAGPAARRNPIALYNCAYLPVDSIASFTEALYISMAGCGVGFSVENQHVSKLPPIVRRGLETVEHVVEDSSEGWVEALTFALTSFFAGKNVTIDYSRIRPAGSILKIKGGHASGPAPLKALINFADILFSKRQRLSSLDAHDLMCKVGDAAVAGGVRRTAMLSLFDFDDELMLNCKSGASIPPHRWNANNSAVINNDMSQAAIMSFMNTMHQSARGEPGIFSRVSANDSLPDRRRDLAGTDYINYGTNPCGEIILREYQFCNLSSVVCRADDTKESLLQKIRLATIIGTIQSTAVEFPVLRSIWSENCAEERLLGVDLNGQRDCPLFVGAGSEELLKELKIRAKSINSMYAQMLSIPESSAITCVKPSGNSSQLLNASSGLHPRWSQYYVRNMRVSANSPMYKLYKLYNVPMVPENGQSAATATTWVISFPVKSPDAAIVASDLTAVDQCNYWLKVKQQYTEHNPSVTITYKVNELLDVAKWVHTNQHLINGMAFLPRYDSAYDNMPYVEITRDEYVKLKREFPSRINYARLYALELYDQTTAAQELACLSGVCEI